MLNEVVILLALFLCVECGFSQSPPVISDFVGEWSFGEAEELINISYEGSEITVQYKSIADGFEERYFDDCSIHDGLVLGNFWGGVENVNIEFDRKKNQLLLTINPFHNFSPIIRQEFVQLSPNRLKYVSTDNALNVRSLPSMDAEVIDQIEGGDKVEIISTDPKWYKLGNDEYCCVGKFAKIKYFNSQSEILEGYVFNYYLSDFKPLFIAEIPGKSEVFLLDQINLEKLNFDSIELHNSPFSNYEEHIKHYRINKGLFERLQLGRIGPFFDDGSSNSSEYYELRYSLNGTVDISSNFYSIIVGYDYRDVFVAYLINYDLNGRFIDFIEVQSGDTVESFTYESEEYAKDQVIISYYLLSDDMDEFDFPIYRETSVQIVKVGEDGRFER